MRLQQAELAGQPARHRRDLPVARAGADQDRTDLFGTTAGLRQRRQRRLQRQLLWLPAGVAALLDPGLRGDLLGAHRRPGKTCVPDDVGVAADVLAAHDRQRL
jgi:hypothetical protein